MGLAPTCLTAPIVIERATYERRPHPKTAPRHCYDCNVAPGGIHHLGCEEERCPRCGGQLIMCECEGKVLAVATDSKIGAHRSPK
jgi:hypothetical protein